MNDMNEKGTGAKLLAIWAVTDTIDKTSTQVTKMIILEKLQILCISLHRC